MKKICIAILTISLALLSGCASTSNNTTTKNQTNNETTTINSLAEAQTKIPLTESGREESKDTHLKLTELQDYSPVYELEFAKIKGGTDQQVGFDTNATVVPEPGKKIGALTQVVDPNNSNIVTLSFWNLGAENSVKFGIDGLEYNFEIPSTTSRKIELNKDITYKKYKALIQKATIYPKAISLQISNISDNKLFEEIFFLKVNGENYPPYDFYDNGTERILLYVFENDLSPDKIQSLNIGSKDDFSTINLPLN